jgi:hypothetical protein
MALRTSSAFIRQLSETASPGEQNCPATSHHRWIGFGRIQVYHRQHYWGKAKEVPVLKKKMPFNVTSDDETKIVSYITETQSTGKRREAICVSHCKENVREKNP